MFLWQLTSCVTYKCYSVLSSSSPPNACELTLKQHFHYRYCWHADFALPCYYSEYFNTSLMEILILSSIRNKVLFQRVI